MSGLIFGYPSLLVYSLVIQAVSAVGIGFFLVWHYKIRERWICRFYRRSENLGKELPEGEVKVDEHSSGQKTVAQTYTCVGNRGFKPKDKEVRFGKAVYRLDLAKLTEIDGRKRIMSIDADSGGVLQFGGEWFGGDVEYHDSWLGGRLAHRLAQLVGGLPIDVLLFLVVGIAVGVCIGVPLGIVVKDLFFKPVSESAGEVIGWLVGLVV